ncbi:MAG: DUF5615 family PIN-like protein [bacterium]
MLSVLTRAEKAELLQWVVQDLGDAFPGIESTPGVCGGKPRIVRTRIPNYKVLNEASKDKRAVLTFNRKHFIALHRYQAEHAGTIVCTFDIDLLRF